MSQPSTKDIFEAEIFTAKIFAAGVFRGPVSAFYQQHEVGKLEPRPRHQRIQPRARHGRVTDR